MDESEDPDGTFVLGGYVASAEKWAEFSKEWEEMLPNGVLDKHGYYFKMSEMAARPERLERVPSFYRIIEKYVVMALSCRINAVEFKHALDRIYVPDMEIDWGHMTKPYVVAFRMLMEAFHDYWSKLGRIPAAEKVEFYFDERSEKKIIRKHWDAYMSERPEDIRRHYGNEPRFEDDRDFLPLQAADLWAWWVRKWYMEGTPEKIGKPDFGSWSGSRLDLTKLDIRVDEDGAFKAIKSMLRTQIEPDCQIYDLRQPKG